MNEVKEKLKEHNNQNKKILIILGIMVMIMIVVITPNLIITTKPPIIEEKKVYTSYVGPFAGASPIQQLYSGLGIALSPTTILDLGTINVNVSLVPFLNNSNRFTGTANFTGDIYINNGTKVGSGGGASNFSALISTDNSINIFAETPNNNETLNITINQNKVSTFNSTYDGYNSSYGKFWYNQSNYSSQELTNSYANLWRNESGSYVGLGNQRFNESIGFGTINSSNIINISCSQIKDGSDSNYCTDATAGQLDDVYNGTVKSLIANGIINISTTDPTQNTTFTLLVTNESGSYTEIKWAYNQSNYSSQELHSSYRNFWINQTKSIIDDFARFWRNNTLDLLGITNRWTAPQNFTAQILVQGNLNITSNFTTQNLTITDLSTCTLKTNANGLVYCGIDTTGGQLDDVYNGTVKSLITDGIINITSNDVTQNVTFTLRLTNESGSYAPIRFGYNFTLSDLFNYNETSSILGLTNTWTVQQTFNVHTIITNASINQNLNVLGNITTNNLTIFGNLRLDKIKSSVFLGTSSDGGIISRNNESSSYAPITWGYNQSNYSAKELHGSFFTFWINQTKSIIDGFAKFWFNQSLASENQFGKFWYNESASVWIVQKNTSHIINSQISCKNITGTGLDTDFCADADTGGGSSFNPINIAYLNNTETFTTSQNFSAMTNFFANTTYQGANQSFIGRNAGSTYNTASRIFDNGSCLIIQRGVGKIAICGGSVV